MNPSKEYMTTVKDVPLSYAQLRTENDRLRKELVQAYSECNRMMTVTDHLKECLSQSRQCRRDQAGQQATVRRAILEHSYHILECVKVLHGHGMSNSTQRELLVAARELIEATDPVYLEINDVK